MVMPPFIAAELLSEIDVPSTHERLASIVHSNIVPRLIERHSRSAARDPDPARDPSVSDIANLARLVLDPNIQLSSDFIRKLEQAGHSVENLFVTLLEPAARCLGTMWDNDECSFVDVTYGVARLQQLLALGSHSHSVPEFSRKRSVFMVTLADEKHSLGITMVETFLHAGGWAVTPLHRASIDQVVTMVSSEWFAVAGLTVGSTSHLPQLVSTIRAIRTHSCNPAIGIMVGGPPFAGHPEIVAEVGADATASNAPAAVLMAQRLFDIGAARNWQAQSAGAARPMQPA
ncbi:MAG: cobalamin B12-binding domain-containing protein [Beijerinckiaceae bacterium]|nr:cobalamin B12-binding domain-containing protein [Beijerinckiaceae bacterium]MCZ8300291.1 cobalamin B12-binding domain-containing protein [Beijerinckiaceae bacterium]